MKRNLVIACMAAAAGAAVVFYAAPFQGPVQPVTGLIPPGALLCLEAKDFHAELSAWNASPEKQRWLASARYEGFSRSNLFLKLAAAWQEFSSAAGFVPDWALADSLAGRESALALYDIGNLQFLYVTRLPGARSMQSALWQSRGRYETRHAGGFEFFVRTAGGRTVAFAAAGDCLILATREEYVAGALRLLSGERLPAVMDDGWYKQATAAASAPGDIRLVMNLEELLKTPQFRSYWIQRNVSEIRLYSAGIADIHRADGGIREERVLIRKTETAAVPAGGAERLARLAPDGAAFYRAWSSPQGGDVADLIERKILWPKVAALPNRDYAPEVDVDAPPPAPDEADLETRIDLPPLEATADPQAQALRSLLRTAQLTAALQVQTGQPLPDGVFVQTPSVIAVESAAAWDAAAVRTALPQAAVQGNLLLIANSEELLRQVTARMSRRPAAGDSTSIAVFRHAEAQQDYRKIMCTLERGSGSFFSFDLASLSEVFRSVRGVEIQTRDQGGVVRESVYFVPR